MEPLSSTSAEVRANDFYLAVCDVVQFCRLQIFEAAGVLAAEFHAHIVLADNFAFEG